MEKKIPHYINDPVINAATAPALTLYRPKINYLKAVLYVLAHLAIGFVAAIVWAGIEHRQLKNIFENFGTKLCIVLSVLFLLTLRFTFIWFVRLYQRYARAEIRLLCCMTPSCSAYAILAFRKYGAIWGGIKTIKRLFRCRYPGGIDYP